VSGQPDLASEPDTYRGPDGVRARGKTTGLDFGQDAVMVWELRDGKATRVDLYQTLDEAVAAAQGRSGS
jgi:ketosteroid isomerase-like protein